MCVCVCCMQVAKCNAVWLLESLTDALETRSVLVFAAIGDICRIHCLGYEVYYHTMFANVHNVITS